MKISRLLLTGCILIALLLSAKAQTPVKKVLMEEFTTVLCGVCPPVTYQVNQYHAAHPNAILITIHEGFGRDSMSNASTYSIFNEFKPSWGSFAPAIMIERTVYPTIDSIAYMSTFTSGYDTLVDNALLESPIVGVDISGQYNPLLNSFVANVTATFVDPLPAANYRVNLFLIEDSVSGVGYPGYAQKCYDANFVAQHYPGYPYANDTISGYPHRYVFRQTLTGNAFGTAQTNPVLQSNQSPVLNAPYVYTMTTPLTIPANYNFDRLYLVASVNRYEPGNESGNFVINANRIKLSDLSFTGIAIHDVTGNFKVYPNPSNGNITVEYSMMEPSEMKVSVTDGSGRTVFKGLINQQVLGEHTLVLHTGNLEAGVYTLHFSTANSSGTKQFIITK